MPKAPSAKQSQASRQNLAGHHGPATPEGKRRSAANGGKNRGTKTAKQRALIVAARHPHSMNSFYAIACQPCTRPCLWKSFSPATSLDEMPIACLEEVLKPSPARCFYYFEGVCCATALFKTTRCILDSRFSEELKRPNETMQEALAREVRTRKRTIALVREMQEYLRELRKLGHDGIAWTPRKKHVMRIFHQIVRTARPCKLITADRLAEWDEALMWLEAHRFE